MTEYKDTLNLPQTAFPMKADLARREPQWVEKWKRLKIYERLVAQPGGGKPFILHDGPPYANGDIHFGHILNKVLKDIIVKYHNMKGESAPFVPGWDCHGLPIEHQVDLELAAKKKGMTRLEIRQHCRSYAQKFVELQRNQFMRLGILADWEHPYLTMDFSYEATIAREFADIVKGGFVYKGKKPVLWCFNCRTALAEAEVEYEEDRSPSLYAAFPVEGDVGAMLPTLKGRKVSVVIWTTTPWTLPGNVAVALHPHLDYVAVQDEAGGRDKPVWIVASALKDTFASDTGVASLKVLDRFGAQKLEGLQLGHPIYPDRKSQIILGDMVTMDRGSGGVHIAPGHGQEDYVLGMKYNLPVIAPVDDGGCFTADVAKDELKGLHVFKANPIIEEHLKTRGWLLGSKEIRHSYPHCWRCKKPVIFRATEQWFMAMEKGDLRQKALDQIRHVTWIPSWGRERIYSMVANRGDWCLSRQRSWGVPVMAVTCEGCRHGILDETVLRRAADAFKEHGADWWFATPVEKIVGPNFSCPQCKGRHFKKDEDILDVWFDSGVSHAAVVELRGLVSQQGVADLYLEGTDQHRGWFHSSLLTSVAACGRAPYQSVLTHGFVVDGTGKKYSKSAKNYSPPENVIAANGAELLRLWVAAEDYRNDIRVSPEILARLVEAYRKIRNTFRFMLGNLFDFDPAHHIVEPSQLEPLDRWILAECAELQETLDQAYQNYDFHVVYQKVSGFCITQLSAMYLDILKDRLYVMQAGSMSRRAAQTTLYMVSSNLVRWIAPILSFTAEEIWEHLPPIAKEESIFLARLAKIPAAYIDEETKKKYQKLVKLRQDVNRALEQARQSGQIANPLEALVHLNLGPAAASALGWADETELAKLFIISKITVGGKVVGPVVKGVDYPDLEISVTKAKGTKCARCWLVTEAVGWDVQWPDLCERCAPIMKERGANGKI